MDVDIMKILLTGISILIQYLPNIDTTHPSL